MEIYAKINATKYPVSYGSSFNDELNETLDSGTIILPHVNEVLDIKPYDRIDIYDGDTYFKSFLCGTISRDIVYLNGSYYTYTIQLLSLTKGLETILLPNRTITQPKGLKISDRTKVITKQIQGISGEIGIVGPSGTWYKVPGSIKIKLDPYLYDVKITNSTVNRINYDRTTGVTTCEIHSSRPKALTTANVSYKKVDTSSIRTTFDVIEELVNQYSPYEKVVDNESDNTWKWERKYKLTSPTLDIFKYQIAPEMQFSSPTLREALNQLMLTKDCIVRVNNNNEIEAMSIGVKNNPITNIKGASWEQYTMDSSSYCDRLKRTYSHSLSKESTSTFIEKMGFRNSDSPTMTLGNMRLEFSHPIYKINKINLCCYEKSLSGETYRIFRQDITPLVLQNSVRNLMSEDWSSLSTLPETIEKLSKYKFCTVGYDIGGKHITGWGDRYQYIEGWFRKERTTIENMLLWLSRQKPKYYSFSENDFPSNTLFDIYRNSLVFEESNTIKTNIISPASNPDWANSIPWLSYFINDFTQKIKTIFFECEYEGFIDSAVIISKDEHDGDVVSNDNVANSLSIVETDGKLEKSKANRLGNAAKVINARVNNLNDILSLGDYNNENEIIYKISKTFEKDYISVTYYLCKNYVLKNYYTSVWAKERPFSLASYGESVQRNENRYMCLFLSLDKQYYQGTSNQYEELLNAYEGLVSFFESSYLYGSLSRNKYSVNFSSYYVDINKRYLTDNQIYCCGNSICMNIPMLDNVTSGVEIKKWNPNFQNYFQSVMGHGERDEISSTSYKGLDDITGSIQDWLYISDDTETGYAKNLHFRNTSIDQEVKNDILKDGKDYEYIDDQEIKDIYSNYLNKMPTMYTDESDNLLNISSKVLYKDGKERINMTHEFEAICDDYNIQISDKFFKYSDLNYSAQKSDGKESESSYPASFLLYSGCEYSILNEQDVETNIGVPMITIYVSEGSSTSNLIGLNINEDIEIADEIGSSPFSGTLHLGEIVNATDAEITVNASTDLLSTAYPDESLVTNFQITFYTTANPKKLSEITKYNPIEGESNVWIDANVNNFKSYASTLLKVRLYDGGGNINEYYPLAKILSTNGVPLTYKLYSSSGWLYEAERRNLVTSTKNLLKNIEWYRCSKFNPDTIVDDEVPSDAIPADDEFNIFLNHTQGTSVVKEDYWIQIDSINLPAGDYSLRCYIDGHFVFGVNTSDNSGTIPNKIYLSLLDNRSLKVYKSLTDHEVAGKVMNVANMPEYWGINKYTSD